MSARKKSYVTWLLLGAMLAVAGCRSNQTQPSAPPAATPANSETTAAATPDRPFLSGEIRNLSLYPVPNNHQNLAISLVVTVKNSGATSMAADWRLLVNTTNRDDLKNLEPVFVNGIVEMPGTIGKRVDLAKEDLAMKTKQTSIAKGTELTGILTFVLPKTSADELKANSAYIILLFKDSQGRAYQTPKAIIGTKR